MRPSYTGDLCDERQHAATVKVLEIKQMIASSSVRCRIVIEGGVR
jgi:hypothetical protein